MAPGATTVGLRVTRVALGAVFVCAGTLKALAPADFAWAIHNFRLLPYPLAVALALYLPWLEIVCGLGVCWRGTRLGALNLLLAMCLVFVGALATAWWRHLDIDCGCFGAGAGAASLGFSLARAGLLAVVSGFLLWHELPRPPAAGPAAR